LPAAVWDFELLRILIIPDKFKGSLAAGRAALAMARGWRRVRPQDQLELLPLADGGDGFGEAMARLLGAKPRCFRTKNAARRSCAVRWWWEPKTRTAIIESARVIGLAMLPPGKFHPFELDTFGLGLLLRHAASRGARRCLLGIGGSATNDGGFGLARALGWKFLDREGRQLKQWPDLMKLAQIKPPRNQSRPASAVVGADVTNRLLGPRGATRIYGPQKGLSAGELPLAERCLRQLSIVAAKSLGHDLAAAPGAGAAGGLGFGLLAFTGARLQSGFDLFARTARLKRRLQTVDLVLTGEGKIDRSTLMGKGVGRLAQLCRNTGIPCIALAGQCRADASVKRMFSRVHTLTGLTTATRARKRPAFWLQLLARRTAREFSAL
jgi:glycerate kinase